MIAPSIQSDAQPVLASRAGRYEEALPLPALREHFLCVWTNALAGEEARRITVVPDGCVDLLWRNNRFLVVGPDISAGTPVLSPGRPIVGMRFRPGAAARWLKLPLTEIVGHEVPMTEFWGHEADRFAEGMSAASSLSEEARTFQQLLAGKAATFDNPSREAAAIFEFLRASPRREGEKIKTLQERLDTSERTLRRRSREFFGYGPKTLDRILRFQTFQGLAQSDADEGLAALAFRAGYSDQAHLTREVQALCGMTAGEFLRQLAGGRFIQDGHARPT